MLDSKRLTVADGSDAAAWNTRVSAWSHARYAHMFQLLAEKDMPKIRAVYSCKIGGAVTKIISLTIS